MLKNYKLSALLIFSSLFLFVFCFNTLQNKEEEEFKTILKKVRTRLSTDHFSPSVLDDDFSQKVFKNYLENLDGGKRFFLQEDIDSFKLHENKLDDYFKNQDLGFYNQSMEVFHKRLDDLGFLINQLLVQEIDLNKDEVYFIETAENKESKYAQNPTEWREKWRKYVKSQLVQELYTLQSIEENKNKTENELLIEAKSSVKDNLDDLFRRFKKRKNKDFFGVYINSHLEVYDPHTTYFSPKDKEDFEVNISGQLEGIGAKLEDKKGYATISELIIGGPAWKSKELEPGDKIIKVAQGKDEPVDIIGMLLDESIRLIRGKKGSTVVLTIKKKDNSIKRISIVRDVIEYGETFAKSVIIKNEKGQKYGLIYLPEFYVNMNDRNGRNAASDVKIEIQKLKKEGIVGLIFDVRDNGGGSLPICSEIVGEFIEKGPVVQVKGGKNIDADVLEDSDKNVSWAGPMVVLVNEFSASASEILAAALQDYKRAVIIGSKKTYGKGTVQSYRNSLNELFEFSDHDYGGMKLTTQKFYRIDGGSTQLKGVESDIIIPNEYAYTDVSESNKPYSLQWDKIEKTNFMPWNGKFDLEKIKSKSAERLNKEVYSKNMERKAKWIKQMTDNKQIPISIAKYKSFISENEKTTKQFDSILKYDNKLIFVLPKATVIPKNTEEQKSFKAKSEDWHAKLKKDFTINEALMVLSNMR
jgi:carboxyl-terminal processing protease